MMKVKDEPLISLIPYENNNRLHPAVQIDRIANSISQFGFNQPIVIDEQNIIIVGHGRFEAAKKLGLKDVPVVRVSNLTPTQKRAYRILDNKLQNDSAWAMDALTLELGALEDENFPLEEWGLDEFLALEEEEILEDEELEGEGGLSDEESCFIKPGDVIRLGEHVLICGDCCDPKISKKLLQASSGPIPLMVTDPPYGVEYDPEWREEAGKKGTIGGGALNTDTAFNDDKWDFRAIYEIYSPSIIYQWHAAIKAGGVAAALEEAGYEIASQIIWAKNNFAISRGDYHWKHEPCYYAVKKGKSHNWQGARDQSTLWEIDSGRNETGHSNQKPVQLIARSIRNNSKKGDSVIDPFAGSGTAIIACEQMQRVCYAVEISPVYCHKIIERYERFCLNKKKACRISINDQAFKNRI